MDGLKKNIQDNILDGFNEGRISRKVAEGGLVVQGGETWRVISTFTGKFRIQR
jgi:hypothetical protein